MFKKERNTRYVKSRQFDKGTISVSYEELMKAQNFDSYILTVRDEFRPQTRFFSVDISKKEPDVCMKSLYGRTFSIPKFVQGYKNQFGLYYVK